MRIFVVLVASFLSAVISRQTSNTLRTTAGELWAPETCLELWFVCRAR
jgi:hypothetical protein